MPRSPFRQPVRRLIPLAFMPLIALFLILTQTTPALAACPASFPVTVPASDTARLIEVINCANAVGTNDTINLTNSTYTLTTAISGDTALPLITSGSGTLTINGNGATIARSSAIGTTNLRMFRVNSGATLTLNTITLTNGRETAQNGGAVVNDGTLTVINSIFRGNTATNGAAIFHNAGTLKVINSVFVSNVGDVGGGIAINTGTVTVTNSTFSANTATSGGAAIVAIGSSTVTINNSILANSIGSACNTNSGVTQTIQNSLIESGGCGITNGVNGNKTGDPALVNDTTDLTLQSGSIARNAGSNALAVNQNGSPLVYDQRGANFYRILSGTVDMGAYEYTCPITFPYTVAAGDTPDLINAINCANATAGSDTINLTPYSTYPLTSVYSSDTGLPTISSSGGALTINGNGSIITRSVAGGTPEFRLVSINSGANLTLNGVTLSNGFTGATGGAVFNSGGTLNLIASTISGNTSNGGGGIANIGGTMIVRDSTLSGNSASYGGAIANSSSTLYVINSTISGNSATGTNSSSGGGAIDSYGTSPNVIIRNSTITNNTAVAPNVSRSGYWQETGSTAFYNTIMSNNNGANNCFYTGGNPVSFNVNNIDNGTSCLFVGTYAQNTNPMLAPLAYNGGLTATHALLPGSPAINHGANVSAQDQTGAALSNDQRGSGYPRIINGTVDIGAYETYCTTVGDYNIGASDSASLIQAIICANATMADDVINLTNSTYTLIAVNTSFTGLPPIVAQGTAGTLTINGNGATIRRGTSEGVPGFRIIMMNSGANLTLNQVTISNGLASGGSGGGIYNSGGTLRLVASTVDSNNASSGAGIFNANGSTTTLRESLISNNVATSYGGGVANSDSALNVVNSTISGNSVTTSGSTHGGGAIDSFGDASVVQFWNSTIAFNTAANVERSGYWQESGASAFYNNIFANNGGGDDNCFLLGAWGNIPYNIDSGTSCAFGADSYQNTDPLLAPLADNGGLTKTHALQTGSPAINHGDSGWAVDETDTPLTTDQRGTGYPRIIGSRVDLGAYEAACPSFPATIPAGAINQLVFAIGCANASPANDVINLTGGSVYTMLLPNFFDGETGLPSIYDKNVAGTLTINGNGATIQRLEEGSVPDFRLFYLDPNADLTLNQVTLTNGVANRGGAFFNSGGALTIINSTVTNNHAVTGGGAVINENNGTVTLRNSLLSSNVAGDWGGGFENAFGTINIINSTVTGNSANGQGGGAVDNYNGSTVRVINSTIADNSAPATPTASGLWIEDGTLIIQNSIVANNAGANNCLASSLSVNDQGKNIENGTSCGFSGALGQNTDPKLAALADNGGFTQTYALLPGSPAINAGTNSKAVDENGAALTTDQRGTGYPRIVSGTVDIGAYESICPSFPATIAASDSTGLINAITCANGTTANNVINLTNSTYTLTAEAAFEVGLPPIVTAATAGTLTINGNGATITRSSAGGTPDFKFFEVTTGANLTLNRVTLTNGRAQVGGAIFSDGTLRINDSTISENWALAGGAISQTGSANTILMNSLIANNQAIAVGGAFDVSSGTMHIINSTISGNEVTGSDASYGGGAMDNYNAPTITIINSTITDNTAPQTVRSGIWHESGTLTIRNSIVALNNGSNNCSITGGTLVDGGNNLENDDSCGFGGTVGQFWNPLLAPLANNGGFTKTHALLPGSPAINGGSNALAVNQSGAALTTDQRGTGFARINNTTVDIGAYETQLNSLSVTLSLQGRSNPKPHESYIITVHVKIMPQGGGAVFYNQNYMTDANGNFTIPNLPYGTYLFSFKGTNTLARQYEITITTGSISLETATMRAGDANDDNSVTLSDFSILASSFSRALGEPGYDARADFNGDNLISLNDFSLLASNYGGTGEG